MFRRRVGAVVKRGKGATDKENASGGNIQNPTPTLEKHQHSTVSASAPAVPQPDASHESAGVQQQHLSHLARSPAALSQTSALRMGPKLSMASDAAEAQTSSPQKPASDSVHAEAELTTEVVGDGSDNVLLDDWSFAFNASRPLQLTGRVFSNASGLDDGDTLEYTSQVVEVNGRLATTKSGTTYFLGRPGPNFEQLRKQLWLCSRSGELGRDDGSSVPPLDIERPLRGIKLGEVVPCAPVRLPKVPGWSHQSGVALLHDWKTVRTKAGFVAVVGTVYNCPGSYDGAGDYHTSTVVDCRGRMLRTLEGAEYFLGRRHGADEAEKLGLTGTELVQNEAAALGLLEDLLAV